MSAAFPELNGVDLNKKIDAIRAKVLVVDGELPISSDGVVQKGAAFYDRATDRITVSRPRWKAIQGSLLGRAIGFHELLGLLGLESTGRYPLSARYLSLLGYDGNQGMAALESDAPSADRPEIQDEFACHDALFALPSASASLDQRGSNGCPAISEKDSLATYGYRECFGPHANYRKVHFFKVGGNSRSERFCVFEAGSPAVCFQTPRVYSEDEALRTKNSETYVHLTGTNFVFRFWGGDFGPMTELASSQVFGAEYANAPGTIQLQPYEPLEDEAKFLFDDLLAQNFANYALPSPENLAKVFSSPAEMADGLRACLRVSSPRVRQSACRWIRTYGGQCLY